MPTKPGSEITVRWFDGSEVPEWDQFIENLSGGHPEQTTMHVNMRKRLGWQPSHLVCYSDKQLLGGAMIYTKNIGKFGNIAYVPYGPCISAEFAWYTPHLIQELKTFVKRERVSYITVNLPYFDELLVKEVKKQGFRLLPEEMPPTSLIRSTILVDLSQRVEEITASVHKTLGRKIRRGLASAYTFREGTREELSTFFNLMKSTCARRASQPIPDSLKYFEDLWDAYNTNGIQKFVLFHIEYEGKIVCSSVGFAFGNIFRSWKIGWDGSNSRESPTALINYKNILWAKEKGFDYFDFVSVDQQVAIALESGKPLNEKLKKRYFYGPTVFKMSFGAELVHMPGAWFLFNNRLFGFLVPLAFSVVNRQAWIGKTVKKLWVRSLKNSRKG